MIRKLKEINVIRKLLTLGSSLMVSIEIDGGFDVPDDTLRSMDSLFAFESWKETLFIDAGCWEVGGRLDVVEPFDLRALCWDITA